MSLLFVDTNIPIYAAGKTHPLKATLRSSRNCFTASSLPEIERLDPQQVVQWGARVGSTSGDGLGSAFRCAAWTACRSSAH